MRRRKRLLKRNEEDEEKKSVEKEREKPKRSGETIELIGLDDEESFNYDVCTIVKENDEHFKEIYTRKFYRKNKDGKSKSICLLQN